MLIVSNLRRDRGCTRSSLAQILTVLPILKCVSRLVRINLNQEPSLLRVPVLVARVHLAIVIMGLEIPIIYALDRHHTHHFHGGRHEPPLLVVASVAWPLDESSAGFCASCCYSNDFAAMLCLDVVKAILDGNELPFLVIGFVARPLNELGAGVCASCCYSNKLAAVLGN